MDCRSWAFRPGVPSARSMMILLAEYEKEIVLTPFEPTLWFSWIIIDLAGWSQLESTAGNESSPQRFVLRFGELFVHESCV